MYYTHERGAVKFAEQAGLNMDVVLTQHGYWVPVLPHHTHRMLAEGGKLVCQVRWYSKVNRGVEMELTDKPVHNYGEPEV